MMQLGKRTSDWNCILALIGFMGIWAFLLGGCRERAKSGAATAPAQAAPVETAEEEAKRRDDDRGVIQALRNAGSDLNKAHALEHHFITYNRSKADAVISDELAGGYKASAVSTLNDKSGTQYWYFDLVKSVVPAEETVFAESLRMTRLAKKHEVEYDGWGCVVVK
jgi:regulator of RNase E activity RraB